MRPGTRSGESVRTPLLDVATINATPPTAYTQVTDPSVALRRPGQCLRPDAADHRCQRWRAVADQVQFLRQHAQPSRACRTTASSTSGSPAPTRPPTRSWPSMRRPARRHAPPDPNANNVYIAWASIDTEPANPNPYAGTGFNPNRAELVVGTPVANPVQGEERWLSAACRPSASRYCGNFGPQDDSHPQLVINQNDGGQVTVAWDDFGTGATASPPFDDARCRTSSSPARRTGSPVRPGRSIPATSANSVTTPVTTSFTDNGHRPRTSVGNRRPDRHDRPGRSGERPEPEPDPDRPRRRRARSPWSTTRTMPPARPTRAWASPAAMPSECSVSPRVPPVPRDRRRDDLRRQRHPEHLRLDDHGDQREQPRRTTSATSGLKAVA